MANDDDDPASHTSAKRMQPDCAPAGLNDLAQQLTLAHRSLLNINRRLAEYAHSQRSFASVRDELSKLVGRLSSRTTSMVPTSTSSPTIAPTPSVSFAPSPGSMATDVSAKSMLATAYVAPQVFAEMPTPNSGHGAHVMAPGYENCCYGYPNNIQSSCVQGGSTNLSEQYLDGLPDHYGFDNLNRQSIFRADGTKHSYFTLPKEYPLEQATPPMLLSAVENAGVTTKLSVAAQAADVQDFTLELQQQDDERTCICSTLKASNSLVTQSNQLSIEHIVRELRLLWDPRASTSLHSSKSKPPGKLIYVANMFLQALNLGNQVGTYVHQLRDTRWNVLVTDEKGKQWDPGDTELHVLFMTAAGATKLQCTDVKRGARREPILESATMRSCAFGLGWTEVNASALFVLALPCSTGKSVVDKMSRNGSEFRDGQLAYMPQGTSINSCQWARHMVIVFSCWSPSFEMAKLQWYPGIALSSYRYSWLGSGRTGHKTVKALVWSPSPFFDDLQYHLPMNNTSSIWDPGI